MRVLHLSWEYPPLVYGGLGRHVEALARAQAAAGFEVTVVTQTEGPPARETVEGVRVIRVPRDLPSLPFDEANLLAWVAGLELALTRAVVDMAKDWQPDVVHAHDWVVAHTAVTSRALLNVPVVATFHATEAGRHQGWLPSPLSRAIYSVEWWLAHESTSLITCSEHMRWETDRLFGVGVDKVSVIPNGIDRRVWSTTPQAVERMRARYGGSGPLLISTARLEWEKGIHTLLDAMVDLRRSVPGIRLVIAGRGGKEADLREQAQRLRLGRAATFLGWLPEPDLHAIVAAADVAIVPSIYEPFGLVALEAAALGTPAVVADTGGLAEFADAGRVAVTFKPGDASSLAAAVRDLLADPESAQLREQAADEALSAKYSWDLIAQLAKETYESAKAREPESAGRVTAAPPPAPSGNLLRSPKDS
ncbi:MAG: glycosyltransferase family 4 protein [Candidatus Nanopelagicales bacterium]|nr:glycosyltransferase family 4 protein [Candidatus Nanopelagicales bacterium]MDZ4250161.1 glycosyltransferase family 4 protein [Candidatus Nanopelagicales bacterium]